jgi:ribosome-binding protein aMBF1 (putative translation factor)
MVRQARRATKKCEPGFAYAPYIPIFRTEIVGQTKMTDAVKIMHKRYIKGDPIRLASLKEEHLKIDIAQAIYDLREHMGLSQAHLAKLLGITTVKISRGVNHDKSISSM